MNNARKPGTPPPQMPSTRPGGPMGVRINKEKPKNLFKTLTRLLRYIGKSKMLVIALITIMAIVTVADLAGPALQGEAINTISIDAKTGGIRVDFDAMLWYLGAMGVLFVISATLALLQGIIAAKLSQNTVYKIGRAHV